MDVSVHTLIQQSAGLADANTITHRLPPSLSSSLVREYLNDVWVSVDGGYTVNLSHSDPTVFHFSFFFSNLSLFSLSLSLSFSLSLQWGQCLEDAPFGDSRQPSTVLDNLGRLLVMGGYDTQRSFNDVWRSGMSFFSYSHVSSACNVKIPACGPGLTCLPSDPSYTRKSDGSVSCSALRQCQTSRGIDFTLQTAHAPWSARAASQVELYTKGLTYTPVGSGSSVRVTGSALIIQGSLNLENDVWISTDHGRNWNLLAGVTRSGVHATSPFDSRSFVAADFGGFAVMNDNSIYRIGGRTGPAVCTNAVWASSDGGKTWKNQVVSTSRTFSPLRDETIGLADSAGNLYFMAGRLCGNTAGKSSQSNTRHTLLQPLIPPPDITLASVLINNFFGFSSLVRLNDVWMSSDKGRNWKLQTAGAEWSPRVAPFVVSLKARSSGKDALVLFGGVYQRDMNDVWVSSNQGVTWQLMIGQAPFLSRNNANSEVTKAGLIILTGGKHDQISGCQSHSQPHNPHCALHNLTSSFPLSSSLFLQFANI